jgi:hypothetical protein
MGRHRIDVQENAMTRTLYDGINTDAAIIARDFPAAQMVAGYLDGAYQWTAAEWGLFPHAQHVGIVVSASANAGDVLDVETGDATPAQCAGWIAMRKQAGLWRPTIYCSLAVVPAVRVGTGAYRLAVDYDLWVADWDGTATIPYPSAAAKQERNTSSYDVSVVYDDLWPRRFPPALRSASVTATYSDGSTRVVSL